MFKELKHENCFSAKHLGCLELTRKASQAPRGWVLGTLLAPTDLLRHSVESKF